MANRRRKFDHDAIRADRARGLTFREVAAIHGCSDSLVGMVVNEKTHERMRLYSSMWQTLGTCSVCGAACSRGGRRRKEILCKDCSDLRRATTVRPDTLQCGRCKRWKPDAMFPHHSKLKARRFRHRLCTACGTEIRTDYRIRTRVPCVQCGQPRDKWYPNSARKRRLGRDYTDTGLCRVCYQKARRNK